MVFFHRVQMNLRNETQKTYLFLFLPTLLILEDKKVERIMFELNQSQEQCSKVKSSKVK